MRASAYQPKFALVGAGAVVRSLIGRMHSRAHTLGPVAAVSLRVASRIANSLHAGTAVGSPKEIDGTRVVLFHAPPEQALVLVDFLSDAAIRWRGKSLILCDSELPLTAIRMLQQSGAAIASVKSLPAINSAVIEGHGEPGATAAARRVVLDAGLLPIQVAPGGGILLGAAVTLCTGALSPVIERAAVLLRAAGLRDSEAAQLAARMVGQTASDYAHSGKQSWVWHVRPPDPARLAAEVAAAPEGTREFLRQLIIAGLEDLVRHPEVADRLRALLSPGQRVQGAG